VGPNRETPPLGIGQAEPTSTELLTQKPVLGHKVRDRIPFPAFEPASQSRQHELEGREVGHEAELMSRAGSRHVGRIVKHYGPLRVQA
jgi:hypothetical protein